MNDTPSIDTPAAQNALATTSDPWSNGPIEPSTSAVQAAPADSADAASAWDSPGATAPSADGDAWGASSTDALSANPNASDDWLAAAPAPSDSTPLQQLFDGTLPVADWINQGLDWVVTHFRPLFQALRTPIDSTLNGVEGALTATPASLIIAVLALLAWQFSGVGLAAFAVVALALVAMLGIWTDAMVTLSLVLT